MLDIDSSYLTDFYSRNATLGSGVRNKVLDFYESFWRALEYDARDRDFWGRQLAAGGRSQHPGGPTFESMEEHNSESVPFDLRRPPAPSRMARTIITQFTNELFSPDKRPALRVLGDPLSEEYLDGIVQAGQLWAAMVEARNLGGAIGSVFVSFAFHAGKPVFEIHNAKLCIPRWKDRATNTLESVDLTYQFPREVRTRKGWQTQWFWYRRFMGRDADVVFEPVPVGFDLQREGTWVPTNVVEHRFGFVPGVWIKNTRDSSSVDGEPDCYGQFESITHYDVLTGLASIGTIPNCDPTLYLTTNQNAAVIKKGSKNAIVLKPGDSAGYLEINGTGAATALTVAAGRKADILEAVSCVLEEKDAGASAATATEIRHKYRSFFGKVDVFRGQYGEGLRELAQKLLDAARIVKAPAEAAPEVEDDEFEGTTLSTERKQGLAPPPLPDEETDGPEDDAAGRPQVYTLDIPPRIVDADGDPGTPAELQPRELGPGGVIECSWPEHVTPTPGEVGALITALTAAEAAGYIDTETAARLFAQSIGLNDAAAIFRKATAEKEERTAKAQAALDAQLQAASALGGFGADDGRQAPPQQGESDERGALPGESDDAE